MNKKETKEKIIKDMLYKSLSLEGYYMKYFPEQNPNHIGKKDLFPAIDTGYRLIYKDRWVFRVISPPLKPYYSIDFYVTRPSNLKKDLFRVLRMMSISNSDMKYGEIKPINEFFEEITGFKNIIGVGC